MRIRLYAYTLDTFRKMRFHLHAANLDTFLKMQVHLHARPIQKGGENGGGGNRGRVT